MKTKLISLLLLGGALLFSSCDENKKENGGQLNADESRTRLEQTGRELVSLLNPNEQADLLEVIDRFYVIAEDIEMRYDDTAVKAAEAILAPMKQIGNGNAKAAMQYAQVNNTYVLGAEGAYGIYTYDEYYEEWSYTASDNTLEFRFQVNGKNTVISATASGQTYEYTYSDECYSCTPSHKDTYIAKIPATVKATITKGTAKLADLSINGKYRTGGTDPVATDVRLVMGSYDIAASAYVGTDAVRNSVSMKIGGKDVWSENVEAKGNFRLDPDYYIEEGENGDWDYISDFVNISSIGANIRILDLDITAGCSNFSKTERNFSDLMNQDLSSETLIKRLASLINSSFTNSASFGGEEFAKLVFKAQYDEYGEAYYLMPVLEFTNDGAQFSIYEYFNEENFGDLTERFEDLYYQYLNCLPNIAGDLE